MQDSGVYHIGDNREIMRQMISEGVKAQMCVTSPPYWGLRDYGTAQWEGGADECDHSYEVKSPLNAGFNERCGNSPGLKKQESQRHSRLFLGECPKCGAIRVDNQLGLEPTPEAYVNNLVDVFDHVKSLLADDGVLWLNLGDSYSGSGVNDGSKNPGMSNAAERGDVKNKRPQGVTGIKPKDLVGIPWMVAFALRADGWYLRSDIIWHKPNPMPESVKDRPTRAHEYIFLLSKSRKYYYDGDAIREPHHENSIKRAESPVNSFGGSHQEAGARISAGEESNHVQLNPLGANKRSVWTVTTIGFNEAHFATFPPKLIEPCILAGSRLGDIVFDPFFGSGTTGEVAERLGRRWLGIDLNPEYEPLIKKRTKQESLLTWR